MYTHKNPFIDFVQNTFIHIFTQIYHVWNIYTDSNITHITHAIHTLYAINAIQYNTHIYIDTFHIHIYICNTIHM